MITKQQMLALERQRPTQNAERHYTIDGPVEAAVHSSVEAERIGQLNAGHRKLAEAETKLTHSIAFASREGQAKAGFQQAATARRLGAEREAAALSNEQSAGIGMAGPAD
ncbi:hypothetical protein MJD09_05120 [bacterium]|nr:hypothetical protein [bacterium]